MIGVVREGIMGRKKGYDAPEGVKLPPFPFWWINFTHSRKLIRESTKTKKLDDAIAIFEEVKTALSSINPRSKTIVERYLENQGKKEN